MIHYSPCGRPVDMLRRPYRTKARLLRDDATEFTIRWFRAHPDAKPLPFPSAVNSLDWHTHPEKKEGVGEVYGAARTFAKEKAPPFLTDHICGTPEEHRRGEVFDAAKPPTKYLPLSGLPECCAPGRREVRIKVGNRLNLDFDWFELTRPRLLTASLNAAGTVLTLTFESNTQFTGAGALTAINGFNTTLTHIEEGDPFRKVHTFDVDPAVPVGRLVTLTIPPNNFRLDTDEPSGNLLIAGFPIMREGVSGCPFATPIPSYPFTLLFSMTAGEERWWILPSTHKVVNFSVHAGATDSHSVTLIVYKGSDCDHLEQIAGPTNYATCTNVSPADVHGINVYFRFNAPGEGGPFTVNLIAEPHLCP